MSSSAWEKFTDVNRALPIGPLATSEAASLFSLRVCKKMILLMDKSPDTKKRRNMQWSDHNGGCYDSRKFNFIYSTNFFLYQQQKTFLIALNSTVSIQYRCELVFFLIFCMYISFTLTEFSISDVIQKIRFWFGEDST